MQSKTERDIVFFLGAGFSKPAGLPVMSEFGQEYKTDRYNIKNTHINESHKDYTSKRNAATELVEAFDVYDAFQELCKNNIKSPNFDSDNLETIMCIAESMLEAKIAGLELKGKIYRLSDIMNKMKKSVWKIYQQLPEINYRAKISNEPKEKREVYDKLFRYIKDLNLNRRLSVITTNYDLVYETLSFWNNINENNEKSPACHYPIKGVPKIRVGSGTDEFVNIGEDFQSVPILKLHGSVNYFQENGKKKKVFITNNLSDGEPIGRTILSKEKPAIFALDAIWYVENIINNKLIPAIIPPTYAKLTGQAWLREIWHEALIALSNAKVIIFIGYSMPESDGFMRSLFHASMVLRGSKTKPKICVIDPGEVYCKYKKVFGEVDHQKINFDLEAVDYLKKNYFL